MKKQAQISLEFALTISFLIFIFIAAEVFVLQRAYAKGKESLVFMYNDYVRTLSKEFLIAKGVPDYYERNITVLKDLQGAEFEVTVYTFDNHAEVVLKPERGNFGEFVFALPFEVEGDREILGKTRIVKDDGKVCIDPCP